MNGSEGSLNVSRKKSRIIRISAVLAILAAGLGLFIYAQQRSATPLDNYTERTDYTLYYPVSIPDGYELAASSVRMSDAIIFFTLQSPKNPAITITEQALPPGFDPTKMAGKDAPPVVVTDDGTLYNLSTGAQSKYMLVTSTTLVFINATSTVSSGIINSLAHSLERL